MMGKAGSMPAGGMTVAVSYGGKMDNRRGDAMEDQTGNEARLAQGAIWVDATVQEEMYRIRDAINEVERAGAAEEVDLSDMEFVEEEFVAALASFDRVMTAFRHQRREAQKQSVRASRAMSEPLEGKPITRTKWSEIPARVLIDFLGDKGDASHPRHIFKPSVLTDEHRLPAELLPVKEIVASNAPTGTVLFGDDGREVAAMQGVVVGDLIDAIAEGLGVAMPTDAPRGYSGSRLKLAAAIVRHVKATG